MKPPEQTPDRIAAVFRWCNWCQGHASDVRLVAAQDQGSGGRQPGAYACPQHRREHGLTPLADQS
jgi:hypothetical protein